MTKYLLLLIIIYFVIINNLSAQDKINTDRPDATESAILTPHHYFQAEFGAGKENLGGNNYNAVFPTTLIKYGLTKNFELRLQTNFATENRQIGSQLQSTHGFEPIAVGFRTGLIQQKKLIPQTALIASVGIPAFASQNFKTKHLAPEILLSMQNSITKNFGVGYNVGVAWDGVNTSPGWLYTLSFGFDLTKHWDAFIETFGVAAATAKAQNSIDAGIGFYLNNNIRLDVSAGIGISDETPNNFFGAGISFRFK